MGNYSVIQELHRCGVPVVVGSQLPLTKPGSVEFAQAFYRPLFEGTDVRAVLHAGRVAVRKDTKADHDWMSIVAYVRLPPEGYAQYLQAFGLRAELGILKTLQTAVDNLIINGGSETAFDRVETLLVERIASLRARFSKLKDQQKHDLGEECGGLLASAHKRHAELLFTRAGLFLSRRDTDLSHSRVALPEVAGLLS